MSTILVGIALLGLDY